MIGYIVRRLLQSVVVLLGVLTVVFLMLHLLPGDQGRIMLCCRTTPAQWAEYDRQNGLDQSIVVQYVRFLGNVFLHGQIAFTPPGFANSVSIEGLQTSIDLGGLMTPLLHSLLLIGLAYVCILGAGIPLGIYTALRPHRASSRMLQAVSVALYACPAFFMGIVLTVLLTTDLRVLSANTPAWTTGDVLGDPGGLVIPVLTLALGHVALYGRYLRASMLSTLGMDYIATARSKGADEAAIVRRHVLRNSLLPLITLLGTSLPALFGIDVIVEYLFQYPGIGLTLWFAAYGRDFYTLLGVVLVGSVIAVLSSLLADIAYAVVDPRIRYGAT